MEEQKEAEQKLEFLFQTLDYAGIFLKNMELAIEKNIFGEDASSAFENYLEDFRIMLSHLVVEYMLQYSELTTEEKIEEIGMYCEMLNITETVNDSIESINEEIEQRNAVDEVTSGESKSKKMMN
jgi:hypothetical protein